jgi:putative FmdB family regulatory protein
MPIYEFRCEACQQVFEHLALGRDEQIETRCPSCGSEDLSRVMSSCASVMGDSPGAGASSPGQAVQNRSCASAGSCSTLTLPGHSR